MSTADEMLRAEFVPLGVILKARADEQPDHIAIEDEIESLDWASFDGRIDRVAARLQSDGVGPGDVIAIGGVNAVAYVVAFCAAIRIGAAVVPLTTSAAPEPLTAMIADSGARHLFLDQAMGEKLAAATLAGMTLISFDDSSAGISLSRWMADGGSRPESVEIGPEDPFNIIYSSGTTGSPKGIVQSHAMRMGHLRRALTQEMTPASVTLVSTPLYSNTSLVSLLPALAGGGRVVLMAKFDARRFCQKAEQVRATHAMLVPVQYQRIMALPDFETFDLGSFVQKSCTSAPFSPALKADVVKRWPGRLIEVYGMTEGGGTCMLIATDHPDKLHTVGQPAAGHDIRLIDEHGVEVPPGGVGEVVGRSPMMMTSYHLLDAATREAEWHDAEGRRFIRHGDIGRFDEDGFLILMDRRKEMIISGGFNIYPSDLENAFRKHPGVADVAVVGTPSETWGETPVAFVVLRESAATPETILAEVNAGLGRTQRVSSIHALEALPRNAIGKVLKRELKDRL